MENKQKVGSAVKVRSFIHSVCQCMYVCLRRRLPQMCAYEGPRPEAPSTLNPSNYTHSSSSTPPVPKVGNYTTSNDPRKRAKLSSVLEPTPRAQLTVPLLFNCLACNQTQKRSSLARRRACNDSHSNRQRLGPEDIVPRLQPEWVRARANPRQRPERRVAVVVQFGPAQKTAAIAR